MINLCHSNNCAASMYYSLVEDVNVDARKDGRSLNCTQLEKRYHDWINNMHAKYDVEIDGGDDEYTVIINPSSKERLGISEEGEGLPCDLLCSYFRFCSSNIQLRNHASNIIFFLSFVTMVQSRSLEFTPRLVERGKHGKEEII